MSTKDQTIKEIFAKMDKLGDLPVFSASVNHICNMSTDPDSDAMELSQEVLKDANLSVKLLRLSNSPFYNRSMSKVNVISRAVIMLGFDTVKNLSLTMKLIESFQHEHPGIDMDRLLVKAYITAGFVRQLAMKCDIKDAEQTYTCALLHNLGEIAVAYFLPHRYIEIQDLKKEGNMGCIDCETAVLGASIVAIGKELAVAWDFSPKVTATLTSDLEPIKGQITKPLEMNKALSSLGNKLVNSLYSDIPNDQDMHEVMAELATATGIRIEDVENSLTTSFKMSCELAKEYGLPRKKLTPLVIETADEHRDKLARTFSFYANNQPGATPPPEIPAPAEPATAAGEADTQAKEELRQRFDLMKQLQYIQEITALITDGAKLNTALIKALEGIHVALGYERVVLSLLDRDRKEYMGRIAIGIDKEEMKTYFSRVVKPDADIFSRITLEGVDLLVEDTSDARWEGMIPPKFKEKVGAKSFIISAIKSGAKPIGFVYADNGRSPDVVSKEQQMGFIQFIAQARLAIQTCR